MATWFTCVGFGPCKLPSTVSRTKGDVESALLRNSAADTSGWTGANSRIYGYRTRATARKGGIADDIGRRGRVE
jgi:hypothetical protein